MSNRPKKNYESHFGSEPIARPFTDYGCIVRSAVAYRPRSDRRLLY